MLSVGIFIDLRLRPEAGGHVKCWERFAEAAVELQDELALTLHFLGDREEVIQVAENVCYIRHPPRWGTDRLFFLSNSADQTDLAPVNPHLLPYLATYDVLHTTHQLFAFGKTALKFAQQHQKPLVSSIHTDVPRYTEIYTAEAVETLLGQTWLSQFLLETLNLPQQRRRAMERQLNRYWPHCDRVIVSQPQEQQQVAAVIPPERISHLRRGIDKDVFHPDKGDRQRLNRTFGIPADTTLLLFVGRLNPCKNVMTFAHAVRNLLAQGHKVHALLVGEGSSADSIQALLGEAVTLAGTLPYKTLPWVYASADLFVFPSETETFGNVVVEAKTCGLPVVIASRGGVTQLLHKSGLDGLQVEGNDPQAWATAIATLLSQPGRLAVMGQAARLHMEASWPSWRDVLVEDLLPVWQSVAGNQ